MDYLVRKCREVKANRKEFACKISMDHFKSIDEINDILNIAQLDENIPVTSWTGKPQPIAKEIVNTFN